MIPDAEAGNLPGALAERLAADQQWPEAAGRAVLRVGNVPDLKSVLAVQAALQGLPHVRQVQLIRVQYQEAWFAAQGTGAGDWGLALGSEPRFSAMPFLPGIEMLLKGAGMQPSPIVSRRWSPEAVTPPLPVQPVTPVQSPL